MRRATLFALLAMACLAPSAPGAPEPRRVARVRIVDALPPRPGVEDRLEAIRRRIQEALVYPRLAREHGQGGVTLVRFHIDGRGRPQALSVARGSGHWLLDRAARRAVRDAAPLPYVWGRLEVPVHFDLAAN